jgi:hypothetical protein
MTHIGEREMTTQDTRGSNRPVAAIMALVLAATLWLPTVSSSAHASAATPASQNVIVVSASGTYVPALM